MAAASRMDHPRLSPRPRLGGRSRNHHLGLAFPPVPSLPRRSGPLPRISPGRAPSPASTASAPRIPASPASPPGAEAAARSQGRQNGAPSRQTRGGLYVCAFHCPRGRDYPGERESRGLRQDSRCLIDLGLHGGGECAKKWRPERPPSLGRKRPRKREAKPRAGRDITRPGLAST